jgi:hypothetical protein
VRRALAATVAALALAGCDQQGAGGGADPAKGNNAERYARDRQQCQAQVAETVRTRRNIDDSRRDVFSDPTDRFGRSDLPDTMATYGDSRSSDRLVERCLESRGWASQQQKPWWQRITG